MRSKAAEMERHMHHGRQHEGYKILSYAFRQHPVQQTQDQNTKDECQAHFESLLTRDPAPADRGDAPPPPDLAVPPPPLPRPRHQQLRPLISCATDGGAIKNGEPDCRAGYGAHFPNGEINDICGRCSGPESNNRGEIQALVEVAEQTLSLPGPPDIEVYTDSMVLISALNKLGRLVENDFNDVAHADLLRVLARHKFKHGRNFIPHKVKSLHGNHDGSDPWQVANDKADRLAGAGFLMEWDGKVYPDEPVPHHQFEDGLPTQEEVLHALRHLHDTAPGLDKVKVSHIRQSLKYDEQFECLHDENGHTMRIDGDVTTPTTRHQLVHLVQSCFTTGKVPLAFQQAVLVAIPKKPNAVKMTDHRGITLLSVIGKIVTRILLDRARSAPLLSVQHGFRRADGTAVAVAIEKRVSEECYAAGIPLVKTYVDLTKAYDRIPRDLIWDTMKLYGFGPTAIDLVKSLYEDEVRTKVDGDLAGKSFRSLWGVRQGCLLSPFLFNLVMDRVLRTCMPAMQGIPFGTGKDGTENVRKIAICAYADDAVIFSRNREEAERDIARFEGACTAAGLAINIKKTEYMEFPDRRALVDPPHPATRTDIPAAIQRVGPGFTNSGALYMVMPRAQRLKRQRTRGQRQDDDKQACPFTGCTHTAKTREALAAHLRRVHYVNVNMLEKAPTAKGFFEEEEDYTFCNYSGRYKCFDCHAMNKRTAGIRGLTNMRQHLRKYHDPAQRTMYSSRAPLTGPLTRAHHLARARRQHGLDFAAERQQQQQHQHQQGDDSEWSLKLLGEELERCEEFRYLGRIASSNNNDDAAVRARIRIAEATFLKCYRKVLKGGVRADVKLRVWDAILEAQLLYGCESWSLSRKMRAELDRLQQRQLRLLLNLHPTFDRDRGHIMYPPATFVLSRAHRGHLSDKCDAAALRFFGHLNRRNASDDARFLLEARIPGMSGRPAPARRVVRRWRNLVTEYDMEKIDPKRRSVWRRGIQQHLKGLRTAATSVAGSGSQNQQVREPVADGGNPA